MTGIEYINVTFTEKKSGGTVSIAYMVNYD